MKMTPSHKWTFKTRLRSGAYGWKASALASKRLKEAVREIKSAAKSDLVLAGDGIVTLIERIWPSLQDIDTSSGSLGSAVNPVGPDERLPHAQIPRPRPPRRRRLRIKNSPNHWTTTPAAHTICCRRVKCYFLLMRSSWQAT